MSCTRFEEMRGEGMPECVTADVLDQTGRAHSFLNGPLQDRFMDMMAAFLASSLVVRVQHMVPIRRPFEPPGVVAPQSVPDRRKITLMFSGAFFASVETPC